MLSMVTALKKMRFSGTILNTATYCFTKGTEKILF